MAEGFGRDTSQLMEEIHVESPLRKNLISKCAFSKAVGMALEDVEKMKESHNYESIVVHFGVREKNESSRLDGLNLMQKKQEEALQIKIQQHYEEISRIGYAESEEELAAIQKKYQQQRAILENRNQGFKPSEYVPCVLVQATPKKPLYGKIFQEFDRKGIAMLKATLGYRSPLFSNLRIDPKEYPPLLFDKAELQVLTPPMEFFKKRQYYQFDLSWMASLPSKRQTQLYCGAQVSCNPIFRGIDEKSYGCTVGTAGESHRTEIEIVSRYPRVYERVAESVQAGHHLPSMKLSLKKDLVLSDSLKKGEIFTGAYRQIKAQSTIPFLSGASFLRVQLMHRQFFDIFGWSKHFKNPKVKNFLRFSNVEYNLNGKFMFSRSHKVSDMLENIEVRGFEYDRRPATDTFQGKFSLKFNNYNYPILSQVGIVPFLYAQAGLSAQGRVEKPYMLGSGGIGVSYALNKTVNLELLYSLFQAQSGKSREPVNFQIRIGILD